METIFFYFSLLLGIAIPPVLFRQRRRHLSRRLGRQLVRRMEAAPRQVPRIVQRYLDHRFFISTTHVLVSLGITVGYGFGAGIYTQSLQLGFFFGGVAFFCSMTYLAMQSRNDIGNVRSGGMVQAYHKLIEGEHLELVLPFLENCLNSRNLKELKTVIELLGLWGGEDAVKLLDEFSDRPSSSDRRANYLVMGSRKTAVELHEMLSAAQTGTSGLLALMEASDGYYYRWIASDKPLLPDSPKEKSTLEERMREFVRQQKELKAETRYGFCTRCVVRPVERKLRDHRIVICPVCEELDALIPDVRTVVGRIGPGREGTGDGIHYMVSLWDGENQKARPGQIDELHIVSGADWNYDWAVAAVVEALRNARPEGEALWKSFMVDPGVDLSTNSLTLLNSSDA